MIRGSHARALASSNTSSSAERAPDTSSPCGPCGGKAEEHTERGGRWRGVRRRVNRNCRVHPLRRSRRGDPPQRQCSALLCTALHLEVLSNLHLRARHLVLLHAAQRLEHAAAGKGTEQTEHARATSAQRRQTAAGTVGRRVTVVAPAEMAQRIASVCTDPLAASVSMAAAALHWTSECEQPVRSAVHASATFSTGTDEKWMQRSNAPSE